MFSIQVVRDVTPWCWVSVPWLRLQVWSSARTFWPSCHWKTKALRSPQTSGNTTQQHGITVRNSWMTSDTAGRTQNIAVRKLTHDAWPQTICYDLSKELYASILYVTKKDNFLAHLLLSIGSLSLPNAPNSPRKFICSFHCAEEAGFTLLRNVGESCQSVLWYSRRLQYSSTTLWKPRITRSFPS